MAGTQISIRAGWVMILARLFEDTFIYGDRACDGAHHDMAAWPSRMSRPGPLAVSEIRCSDDSLHSAVPVLPIFLRLRWRNQACCRKAYLLREHDEEIQKRRIYLVRTR